MNILSLREALVTCAGRWLTGTPTSVSCLLTCHCPSWVTGLGPMFRDRTGWSVHDGRVLQREGWITEAIIAICHTASHSLRVGTISYLTSNPQGSAWCLEHSEVVISVCWAKNEWPCKSPSGWNQNQWVIFYFFCSLTLHLKRSLSNIDWLCFINIS